MSELSGPQWCARYPSSKLTSHLLPDFRERVDAFLARLKNAGPGVQNGDTCRPPERAYLMHWCCMIADSGQDPSAVPAMAGVNIQWSHDSVPARARAAARVT